MSDNAEDVVFKRSDKNDQKTEYSNSSVYEQTVSDPTSAVDESASKELDVGFKSVIANLMESRTDADKFISIPASEEAPESRSPFPTESALSNSQSEPGAECPPMKTEPASLSESSNDAATAETFSLNTVEWTFPTPKLFATIDREFQHDYHEKPLFNNYLRGCKWSPDGLCLLTLSSDNAFRLFNFPTTQTGSDTTFNFEAKPLTEELPVALKCLERDLVYDYCWYPLMDSGDVDTCFFLSTGRRMPVRLWDAYNGEHRASYFPLDHAHEMISARSLAFSPDGKLIYCGLNRHIQVFRTDRPGRVLNRRPEIGKAAYQGGILSALATPTRPGLTASPRLYAAGSFAGTVRLYDEGVKDHVASELLQGPAKGVSQLDFVPVPSGVATWYLVAGGRTDGEIFIWDARLLKAPLTVLKRRVENYQRFQFDVDPSGRYLFTGNQTGVVSCFDLTTHTLRAMWRAHEDSCHGISLHPWLPLLATSAGQRRPLRTPLLREPSAKVPDTPTSPAAKRPRIETSDSSSSEDDDSDFEVAGRGLEEVEAMLVEGERLPMARKLDLLPIRKEVKFWSFPHLPEGMA